MAQTRNESPLRTFSAYVKTTGPGGNVTDGQDVQSLLDQKPKNPTPGIGGVDTGEVQAIKIGPIDTKDIPLVGDLEKKIEDEIKGSTKVNIVIRNKSDKTLQLNGKAKLQGWAEWKSGPPLQIDAAKEGKPNEATMILETKWGAAGNYVKDIVVDMSYKVVVDGKESIINMHLKRTSIRGKTSHSEEMKPSADGYKILGNDKDEHNFEFIFEGGTGEDAKGKDSSDVSCRVTIHNDTKYELNLSSDFKAELGDFAINPPNKIPPGPGTKGEFFCVQTPHQKDPKKQGSKGYLIYDVGSPVIARWLCKWDNPIGEKNSAGVDLGKSVEGLRTTGHADQGDENVPFDFYLTSEEVAATSVEYTVEPFAVGKSDALEKGSLEGSINELVKKIPQAARDAWDQGEPGGVKISVHGYASNTGPEKFNLDLSAKRADKVIALLKKVTGAPDSVFTNTKAHGEWETEKPTDEKAKEKEDANWRKVVVKVYVK